ncbi:MAG: hypothetical protein L3K26_03485, partial [Candidatus Hydrogenedentes bacterium]|nr:hypothetical protein [Candidatus Hydrogenedentota bacterium]
MPTFSSSRAFKREIITATSIFLVATCVGMVYVSSWGQTADILQVGFGPSVMLGCGRGFVNPQASAVPELAAFLRPDLHHDGPPEMDSFSCALLPEDMPTVPFTGIQRRTWHMFWIAGWVWRVFGVAWSSLTPLYGVLFGLTAVAAYALFRLLLNPAVAVFCTTLFVMSPVQLHYLPRLRDFAKAPFMLLALFCLVLLLAYPKGWKRALWTGALAGACIGLATGFRAEAVMYLVLFVPAVLLFYPGWHWPTWGARFLTITAFLVCFVVAAWPVIMKFQTYGERTHPFLMGFAEIYDGRLGVDNETYQVAQRFLDAEALAQLNAHNQFLNASAKPIIYETEGYEAVGDDYFVRNLLWKLPGDLATRTNASALRILDELRGGGMPRGISHRFLESLYSGRAWLMDTLFSRTRYVALALLLLLGALSPRLGLLVLYLLFCLAGMASVQFATRHYFHLEFISLLVGGAVLHLLWLGVTLLHSETRVRVRENYLTRAWLTGRLKAGLSFAVVALLLVLLPWQILRWHQDRQLTALFSDYESAETETVWPTIVSQDDGRVRLACGPITLAGGLPETGPEGFFPVDMLVVELAPGDTPINLRFASTGDPPTHALDW